MFKWILDHLKIIAITSLILGLWVTLSVVINTYIDWSKITDLFSIIKWAFWAMDWINDTATMLICVGLSLILEGAEWALEGGLIPIKWFKSSNN